MAKGKLKAGISTAEGGAFNKAKYRIPRGAQDYILIPDTTTATLRTKNRAPKEATLPQEWRRALYCNCDELYKYMKKRFYHVLDLWFNNKSLCQQQNLSHHACFMKYCLQFNLADLLKKYLKLTFTSIGISNRENQIILNITIGQAIDPSELPNFYKPQAFRRPR